MIKVSDLWAEVKKVAAEQPDYVYERIEGKCRYEFAGEPSCLVGHALFRLGVPAELVAEFNDYGPIEQVISAHSEVFGEYSDMEFNYLSLLIAAQDGQDDQYPWGAAVSYAEEFVQ